MSAWKYIGRCDSVEEAKAVACIKGIRLAHLHTKEHFIVETDCAGVAVTIKSTEENRSNCWYLYQEYRQLRPVCRRVMCPML